MSQVEEMELSLADPPACPPCGGQTVLLARFPHVWKNARDEDVTGIREALLCPQCSRGNPAADVLLALFAVDGQLNCGNWDTFTDLTAAWIESVRSVDAARLDAETEMWRHGEL